MADKKARKKSTRKKKTSKRKTRKKAVRRKTARRVSGKSVPTSSRSDVTAAREATYRGPATMETRLSATEVARSFSDVVNRVHYRGLSVTVERGGKPFCRIVPVGPPEVTLRDLVRVLEALPAADNRFADDLEDIAATQFPVEDSPWER